MSFSLVLASVRACVRVCVCVGLTGSLNRVENSGLISIVIFAAWLEPWEHRSTTGLQVPCEQPLGSPDFLPSHRGRPHMCVVFFSLKKK